MSDKESRAAGWVVQVVIIPHGGGAPSYKYFNVAIADEAKAVEATRKLPDAAHANRVEAVSGLSSGEIAALQIKTGEVKPA